MLRILDHLGARTPARTWHGDCLDTSISAFGRFRRQVRTRRQRQHPAEKISTIGINWYIKKVAGAFHMCYLQKFHAANLSIYHGQEQYLRDG